VQAAVQQAALQKARAAAATAQKEHRALRWAARPSS